MLPQLPLEGLNRQRDLVLVLPGAILLVVAAPMLPGVLLGVVAVLMQLLGAVGALKLMTLAGKSGKGEEGQQKREKAFHRRVL